MDEQQFDQLSRRFAGARTRRQALKAIAGAVVAAVSSSRLAAAQECAPLYSPCESDEQCCADAVCQSGLCVPGCRIDGAFHHPWASPAGDICRQCLPESSTSAWSPTNEGMSCWSGDANTGVAVCQAGTCAPVAPASCPPPTPCHLEGEVDPVTGICVNPPAPEGTLCGIGPICHGGFYQPADMCDGAGFCIGGGSRTVSCAPYQCGEGSCTTTCGSDSDCAAGATCCAGSCTALNTIEHCGGCDIPCTAPDACTPAACDNGACITESSCAGGSCLEGECCTPLTCDELGYGQFVTCGISVDCPPPDGFCADDAEHHSACPGNTQINCYCYETTEGQMACHQGGQFCDQLTACASSTECPDGTLCSAQSGVCPGYCVRGCVGP